MNRGTVNASAFLSPCRPPPDLTAGTKQSGSAPSTRHKGGGWGQGQVAKHSQKPDKKADFFPTM